MRFGRRAQRSIAGVPQDPDVEQIVRDFFASDRAISMELPDGWFGGRPYENQHEPTFIAMRPHKLILELDGQVYLIFTEAKTVERRGGRLIVEDFDQVVLDRQGYGDMRAHVSVYDRGCVTFHAPARRRN